jgi:hypothetical protein
MLIYFEFSNFESLFKLRRQKVYKIYEFNSIEKNLIIAKYYADFNPVKSTIERKKNIQT